MSIESSHLRSRFASYDDIDLLRTHFSWIKSEKQTADDFFVLIIRPLILIFNGPHSFRMPTRFNSLHDFVF